MGEADRVRSVVRTGAFTTFLCYLLCYLGLIYTNCFSCFNFYFSIYVLLLYGVLRSAGEVVGMKLTNILEI